MTFFLVIHCCSTNFVVLVNKASPSFFPHLLSIQSFSIFPRFVTLQSQSVVHSMKFDRDDNEAGRNQTKGASSLPHSLFGVKKTHTGWVGSGKVGGI